ncbi:MAG: valine--tRNA ligase [Spirochaetia bacterium]|jgi:valyl-tRNA synthetase|nr:valine--tRNA ligase [Spirochaetia bacterium]
MKAVELEKTYNPVDFEDRIYDQWIKNNEFLPRIREGVKPFVIVIPPPNVTGVLHMGHGLNNSLQDILIRYYRMNGIPTLWLPGTDHAGIATQNVVEKRLLADGIKRVDLGREKFIEKTWEVKKEHHSIIIDQLKKIGSSCDWSRERFTLDEGLSSAVREVFVTLYERNLIYKGKYLVNWCASCGTALSDDEVDHQELDGKMYHYYYPLEDGSGQLEIATTRPETMLGDTALAVNPDDKRYTKYIGKKARLPLTDRIIPIVADSYVSMEFGTGVVKVTPAHDPNDWEISGRHNLEKINILNEDRTLNSNVPEKYRGMSVMEARKAVVEDIKKLGLYIKDVVHKHQVGHCYRCHNVVEPYMSEQWFVKMKPLAEKALDAWKKDEIAFYPKKWENTYKHWLENIKDWCISRQLWWGHRIPVWYCNDCGEMVVSRIDVNKCPKCLSKNLRQDEDVLDTWFSSWLWPFSTLGWPEKTDDVKYFFPTSALVTAYDIIFFWVARMIMVSLEFMGEVPFRDIYIHGLIRDKHGRKMSKSLGNGINPLEIVNEYGADAFKFTLAFLAAQGQDILIDSESFKFGSKFANKLWNASRYILMNLEERNLLDYESVKKNDIDRWIIHRLNETSSVIEKALKSYRFNDAAKAAYEYFWEDFCDWYIEASKLSLYSEEPAEKDRAITILLHLLSETLKLLHPFLSYITEEIYLKIPGNNSSIVNSQYPVFDAASSDEKLAENMKLLQDFIRQVRTLRSEFVIPPSKKINLKICFDSSFASGDFFKDNSPLIAMLVAAKEIGFVDSRPAEGGNIPVAGAGYEAYIAVRDVIDVPMEIQKLEKEIVKADMLYKRAAGKLSNPQFMDKAPDDIIEKERNTKAELGEKIEKMKSYIAELQ